MRRSHYLPRMETLLSFRHDRIVLTVAILVIVLATLRPHTAFAIPVDPDDDPNPPSQKMGAPTSFAFSAPRGFFALKFGKYDPRAASDIYMFNAEQQTLDLDSYNTVNLALEFGYSFNDRVDVSIGWDISASEPVSEMRDWVDNEGSPIIQHTRLKQMPITVSVRFNLVERGQSIGNFTWVPKRVVPYLGAGAGITFWSYEQFGDFVDFTDSTIFTDHFLSKGWSPIAQLFGGLDWAIKPHFLVELEMRYSWAEGQLSPAFVGFEPIDLAGLRSMVGALFRF